jgi:CTP synthase
LQYHAEGLDAEVLRHFGMTAPEPNLAVWDDIVDRYQNPEGEVTIGVVGKYVGLQTPTSRSTRRWRTVAWPTA